MVADSRVVGSTRPGWHAARDKSHIFFVGDPPLPVTARLLDAVQRFAESCTPGLGCRTT
ncbi:hypothetical protein [Haladaptatus sp. DJG-WS-42]|uniref:hypothetical protein n=1 Tax=Haladaptatus sp. DJG-WS-42 TaxID=3120516 RepID=UPI0030D26988